jgi:hypothetical protein
MTKATNSTTSRQALLAGSADHAAVLDRAEFMIECLRIKYICEGWHGHGLDEDAAARALTYFRGQAAGKRDNANEDQTGRVIARLGMANRAVRILLC